MSSMLRGLILLLEQFSLRVTVDRLSSKRLLLIEALSLQTIDVSLGVLSLNFYFSLYLSLYRFEGVHFVIIRWMTLFRIQQKILCCIFLVEVGMDRALP